MTPTQVAVFRNFELTDVSGPDYAFFLPRKKYKRFNHKMTVILNVTSVNCPSQLSLGISGENNLV